MDNLSTENLMQKLVTLCHLKASLSCQNFFTVMETHNLAKSMFLHSE